MRLDRGQLFSVLMEVLIKGGTDADQATSVAENLIWCDMVGRRKYGVERLPIMLKHVAAGNFHCPPNFKHERFTPSTERLDADQAFGHHAGRIAIDRAIDMADERGVGIVGVTNSNFFGAGAYYVNRAAEANKISLVLSNSVPNVAAPGGLRAVLGTNPFAFGAPMRNGHNLLVDMATSATAGSTFREKIASGMQFEPGVAIDADGEPFLDPKKATGGTLLPAAGAKGFGLALMVETLSAVLTGAAISHEVNSLYKDTGKSGGNGHFFMAIDVQKWMTLEEYFDRMDSLTSYLYHSGREEGVRLPGQERWRHYQESQKKGILIEPDTLKKFEQIATELDVRLSWRDSNT